LPRRCCRLPEIRAARLDDAAPLAAIGLEVWLNTYLRAGVSGFFADYALSEFTTANFAARLADPQEAFLVADGAVGPVGFLRVSQNRPAPGCSDLELTTLYIQPRHQGTGLGARLLHQGLAFAATTGRPDVWLAVNAENTRATAFYLRHGFEHIADTRFEIGDQSYPNHVLRRVLG